MGQFSLSALPDTESADAVQCDQCHKPFDWSAVNFDHNRDSRFNLEGAHLKVSCSQCHKTTTISGVHTILYKPLDITCSSCHVKREMNQEG